MSVRLKVLACTFLVSMFFTPDLKLAHAASRCNTIFKADRPAALDSVTIKQWLAWETSPTVPGWEQEKPKSQLPIVRIIGSTVKVEVLSQKDIVDLKSVLESSESDEFSWFQHPYNTDRTVPNSSLTPFKYGLAFHTASRTVVSEVNGRLISIKMPTNFPFGPNKEHCPEKTEMDLDLKYSVARSKAIEQIDNQVGADHSLRIQKELAAVVDRKTGNGYLFRDMSHFKDGRFYLPAHLIPTIGRELAEKLGISVTEYWESHWAKAIGKIQAKLLYRYGMEVREVNPQNFVIELDDKMAPTGIVLWRDLAESHLVKPIASLIGLDEFIERDYQNGGWGVHTETHVRSKFISWNFFMSNSEFPSQTPDSWTKAHDQGFRDEVQQALRVRIPSEMPINDYLTEQMRTGGNSKLIKAIRKWHLKHKLRSNSLWNSPTRVLKIVA